MEIILYIYFGIHLMMVGSYLFYAGIVFIFFGGILIVYEFTFADKVADWWDSSELNFIWQVYILKKFDNLEKDRVEYLEKSLSAQKDKNSKLYKHLTVILKRNEHTK